MVIGDRPLWYLLDLQPQHDAHYDFAPTSMRLALQTWA